MNDSTTLMEVDTLSPIPTVGDNCSCEEILANCGTINDATKVTEVSLRADLKSELQGRAAGSLSFTEAINRLLQHGILNQTAPISSDLSNEIHPLVSREKLAHILTPKAYCKLMPAWRLFSKFVREPQVVKYYTTNALATQGYHHCRRDANSQTTSPISLTRDDIARWVSAEYKRPTDPTIKTDPYNRIYLLPPSGDIEDTTNINATIAFINELPQYIRYVDKPIDSNVFAQADICRDAANNISGPRRHEFDEILYGVEIQVNPAMIKFAESEAFGVDKDPALHLRFCFLVAGTLGHELVHAINYLRFYAPDQDISLEDEHVIWNSMLNKECEDGIAWEINMFGHIIEPLPYPCNTDELVKNGELIPKYGLQAYEWPEGGQKAISNTQNRYAIPMRYITQWFLESTWENIRDTGEPIIEHPRCGLEIMWIGKRPYGDRLLEWKTEEKMRPQIMRIGVSR